MTRNVLADEKLLRYDLKNKFLFKWLVFILEWFVFVPLA